MKDNFVGVLVVDDHEPWRRFLSLTLQKQPRMRIIGEASDGLEATQKAQKLQPDLVVLDISLPKLNGIEAARRIRITSPHSRILFVTENRSLDIAEEALRIGADGFLVKSDAAKDLWPAIEAVLHGTRFISTSVANRDPFENKRTAVRPIRGNIGALSEKAATNRRHEVALYEDDASLVDGFACFVKSALQIGNSAIVVATELHRASIFRKLAADGIDLYAAMEQGRYVSLDVGETLSAFMINNMPDTLRLSEIADDLIRRSLAAATGERPRVAACGDCAPTLLAEGHLDAAIQLEHLWDEVTRRYEIDILCGYLRKHSLSEKKNPALKKICAEHSAVYGF